MDFKNAVIVMTSNIGVAGLDAGPQIGIRGTRDEGPREVRHERMRKKILDEIKKVFKPEFINRLDEIVVFHSLEMEEIQQIVDLMIQKVRHEVESQQRRMEVTPAAKEVLAKAGYDPQYGARPLRRAIQRMVEDPLAEEFLRGTFPEDSTVLVDVDPDNPEKLLFTRAEQPEEEESEEPVAAE